MVRKRVASGIIATSSAVASTVTGMTWSNLSPHYGIPVLAACAFMLAVAVILWFWPAKGNEDVPPRGPSAETYGPNSPAMAAARDVHFHQYNPPPAAAQERQSPYGSGFSPQALEGLQRALLKGAHVGRPPSELAPPRPQEEPKPTVPLSGVLVRVYAKLKREYGPMPSDEEKRDKRRRAVNLEIMDTVKFQHLHVWGRPRTDSARTLDLITEDEWSDGSLNHLAGRFSVGVSYGQYEYDDLRFDKAEVERAWPTPPETTNDGRP